MTISAKYQYTVGGILILLAFTAGRYSMQQTKVEITKTQQTQKNIDQDKKTNTETIVTTIKTPDGTIKTIKDTKTIADIITDTKIDTTASLTQVVTPPKINTLNISALIANDFSRGILVPTYGISITKQILGPVTVGGFGLTNGVIGVSIGFNF